MARCSIGAQLGYAFSCRQECVQSFDLGLSCGVAESLSKQDRAGRHLVQRVVTYDETKGPACISWLGSADCALMQQALADGISKLFDPSSSNGSSTTTGCQGALQARGPDAEPASGTAGPGEMCLYPQDCKPGYTCPNVSGPACAVCTALPGAGNPCSDGKCGPNAYCDSSKTPALCQSQVADGQPCTSSPECSSQFCYNSACMTQKHPGESCSTDAVCSTYRCYQNVCITPGKAGADCQDSRQCESSCYRGKCIDAHQAGEPCDEDRNCTTNYVCYLHACIGVDDMPEGAPCKVDDNCVDHRCASGICVKPKPNGQPCSDPKGCLTNICFQGACGLPDGQPCAGNKESCRSGGCPLGICGVPKEDGTSCTSPTECKSDVCLAGVCFTLKKKGETCTSTAQCAEYLFCFCSGGRCVAKLPDGASCRVNDDCADGLCKDGSCTSPNACSTDADCPPGKYCAPPASAFLKSMCAARKVNGSPCDKDHECQSKWCSPASQLCKDQPAMGQPCSPFECPLDGYCLGGICTPRKKPGEACDPSFISDLECFAPAYCQGGTCKPMSMVCAPATSGSTCTLFLLCDDSSYCDLLGGLTCKPRRGDGEACQDFMGIVNQCQKGSHCVSGTCAPYARLGQSCAVHACDPGEAYCDGTMVICTALKYRGEPCLSNSECLSDHCQTSGSGTGQCDPYGPCKMP
jgi:hypothetical protein